MEHELGIRRYRYGRPQSTERHSVKVIRLPFIPDGQYLMGTTTLQCGTGFKLTAVVLHLLCTVTVFGEDAVIRVVQRYSTAYGK